VLHKKTPGKAVVAARLYFLGGSENLTPENAGIEEMVLATTELGGSRDYPMDELSEALSARGIQLHAATGQDYSVLGMKCIVAHFEKAWDILADLALNPNLGGKPLEIQRRRQLKAIATRYDRPDQQISLATEDFYFQGHPYSRLQLGKKEVVGELSQEDLRSYHQKKLLRSDRMLLVVVGDLDRKTLRERVAADFQKLPEVGRPFEAAEPPAHEKPRVKVIARPLRTSYVLGYFKAPPPGHPDYAAARMAAAFLSDDLFEQIRTKRRLAYAVSVGVSVRRSNVGYVYISTRKPNEAVSVAIERIEKMTERGISEEDLVEMQQVFVTRRLMKLQTQSAQAKLLARAQLTAGGYKWAERSLEELRRVTPSQVQDALRRYVKNIQFVVVGPSKVDREVFTSL
jgi:predicted Zn-dependent peptidase